METDNTTVSEALLDADQKILKHFIADDSTMTDDIPNLNNDDNEEYLDVKVSLMMASSRGRCSKVCRRYSLTISFTVHHIVGSICK